MSHVRTVEDSIKSNTPTIGQFTRDMGVGKIETYIKFWLINLCQSLDLKRSLSEYHIDETAHLIVSEYKNLTISDINLIFKNAKLGKYGEFFESLTMSKVLGWFSKYYDERLEMCAIISQREASKYKHPTPRSKGKDWKEYLKNK